MTIFKNKQRDHETDKLWDKIRGFFGATCPSSITPPTMNITYHCYLKRGHKFAHRNAAPDGGKAISWAYGDDLFA